MSTKTAKIRSVLMLTAVEKGEWAAHYAAKNSFPKKEVPCSSCNDGITMFGTNLRNRIERFDSVEDFLEQFVCRTCKGKLKRGEAVDTKTVAHHHHHNEDVVNEAPEEEVEFDDSEECSAATEEEVAEEGSYVIEPGDDDDEVEVTATDDSEDETVEEVEETVAEDIVVFDDSDEDESDHQSVNAEALREKYKAFYAMKK